MMKKKITISAVALLISAGLIAAALTVAAPQSVTVQAAEGDPIYMQYEGIPGEVTDRGHENQIEILSFQWGMDQEGTTAGGGGGGAGKVNVHDISITKVLDKSTPKLMQALATGEHARRVELSFNTPGSKPFEFMHVVLENVMVTSYSISGSTSQDRPMESLSLNFEKIKVTYHQQDEKGSATGEPEEFSWNVATNEAL